MALTIDPNLTTAASTALAGAIPPMAIDREWCLGDSLFFINKNTDVFDNRLNSLSSTKLDKNIVTPTTLFIPVNYSTLSNANVQIYDSGIINGSTSTSPWWSGIRTTNSIPNVPQNCVAVLVSIYFNANPGNNNSIAVCIRKNSSESAGAPSTSTTPQNITTAQFNTIRTSGFQKMGLDPTGGTGTAYETEEYTTTIVYFDTSTNTFQLFFADNKSSGAPAATPQYILSVNLLGYYVSVS